MSVNQQSHSYSEGISAFHPSVVFHPLLTFNPRIRYNLWKTNKRGGFKSFLGTFQLERDIQSPKKSRRKNKTNTNQDKSNKQTKKENINFKVFSLRRIPCSFKHRSPSCPFQHAVKILH